MQDAIRRLTEELQAEVDKYDTGANMACVNQVRKKVGCRRVWLDVHKDPNFFVRETRLSYCRDSASHL